MSIFVKRRKSGLLKDIKNSLMQEASTPSAEKQDNVFNNLPVPAYNTRLSASGGKLCMNGIPYALATNGAKGEAVVFEANYHKFVLQNGYCPDFSECAQFADGGAMPGILGRLAEKNRLTLVERNGRKEIILKGYDSIAGIMSAVPRTSETTISPPLPENKPKGAMPVDEKENTRHAFGKYKSGKSERIRNTFYEKYVEYRRTNKGNPGIYEFVKYSGLDYPTLTKLIDKMKSEGAVRIVRKGNKKEIDIIEDFHIKDSPSQERVETFPENETGYPENAKESFGSLLKNPCVGDYLSGLLSNNGSLMKPEVAVKIVGALPFGGAIDEKILEEMEADPEVLEWFDKASENEQRNKKYKHNKNKSESLRLSKLRHFLLELYDKKVVSYNVETDEGSGWRTYLWRISPSAPAELKKLCISEMEEKKRGLEGLKEESDELIYFCKEDKTHPVIPFGSKSYMGASGGDFKCEACGSDLVLESGSRISDSINRDLEKLNAAICEIGQIKV